MKLIIAGSRNIWPSVQFIDDIVKAMFPGFHEGAGTGRFDKSMRDNTEILTWQSDSRLLNGSCRTGVDAMALEWGRSFCDEDSGLPILSIDEYPPDWEQYEKAAGPIRNRQMAEDADALLLLWDGKSRGSANMLKEAKKAGLKIVNIANLSEGSFERYPCPNPALNFRIRTVPGKSVYNVDAITKLTL